jgi:hypothetical protein
LTISAKHNGASGKTTTMLAALLVSGLSACGNGSSTTATAPMVNNKGLTLPHIHIHQEFII